TALHAGAPRRRELRRGHLQVLTVGEITDALVRAVLRIDGAGRDEAARVGALGRDAARGGVDRVGTTVQVPREVIPTELAHRPVPEGVVVRVDVRSREVHLADQRAHVALL